VTKVTEVAAAVIERPDGTFLLACRPEGKPYPGYWEFPGGKIEPGEDPRAALDRELEEELGIRVREATPWIERVYAYTHATVRLHFFRVTAWEGEPRPLEDQAISWQPVEAPDVSPMLPANAPVLAALALPPVMVASTRGRSSSRRRWWASASWCRYGRRGSSRSACNSFFRALSRVARPSARPSW
jgi:8-oxo-dGTP diphosphatase